jgi:ATP phosphoribosyltransferase regulatory subunit
MTPPIARVVATAYRQEEFPLRFCYSGNAYRYNENYQGKVREFSQSGIELIGVNSEDADAEMIAVAVNSILAAGLEEFRIDIGQVEFFEGLLEEAGFDEETAVKVQDMIAQRDYIALEEILEETSISENIKTIFTDLPKLVGSIEILKSTKKLIINKKAISALEKLESLYLLCKAYGIEKYISFDLGMITHLNYYTGIIFRGYTYGTGVSILDGGRYDKLIKQYGMDTPAIGFAIKVNELLNIFERQNIAIEIDMVDTLITYTIKGRSVALSVADQLRSTGVYVENSLFGDNIDKNIAYAKTKKMGGVLYFKDEQHVEIINIESGDRINTTVAALVEQGENK